MFKVTIDIARHGGSLLRYDEYNNRDSGRLDLDIQHTIKILLDAPEVSGIQITLTKGGE